MSFECSDVRVDVVDGKMYFETPGTEMATANLHALLERSREEPRPWLPYVVLTGPEGGGKTETAKRFMLQAQRAATCTLVDRAREARDAPLQLQSSEARQRQEQERAEAKVRAQDFRQRVRDFGHCPRVCAPVIFAPPVDDLTKTIHASMHGDERLPDPRESWYRYEVEKAAEVEPAVMSTSHNKPGSNWVSQHILGALPDSRGNRSDDPLRRTSLAFVDRADRLLQVSDRERRAILQDIKDFPRPVTVVLIGSESLVAAVKAEGTTQTITIPPMEGETFDQVVRLVFGECDPEEVRQLHVASGGSIGPLLHIAGVRGLKPPYAVPDGQVLRLPAPS